MQKNLLFNPNALLAMAVILASISMEAAGQVPLREAIDSASPVEEHFEPLSASELTGTAVVSNDGKSITVNLVNNGTRALNVLGDKAVASAGKYERTARQQTQIIRPPGRVQIPGDVLAVGNSVGTMGSGPVALDALRKAGSPQSLYYGRDEKRRLLAADRFGQRVLFPQETSIGRVFLNGRIIVPAHLTIPVYVYPNQKDVGSLILDVKR